jgi:hypothetical protein
LKKKWKKKEGIRKDRRESPTMMKKKNKEVMKDHIIEAEAASDNRGYKK